MLAVYAVNIPLSDHPNLGYQKSFRSQLETPLRQGRSHDGGIYFAIDVHNIMGHRAPGDGCFFLLTQVKKKE